MRALTKFSRTTTLVTDGLGSAMLASMTFGRFVAPSNKAFKMTCMGRRRERRAIVEQLSERTRLQASMIYWPQLLVFAVFLSNGGMCVPHDNVILLKCTHSHIRLH